MYSTSVLHTYDSYTFLPPISYIKIGPDESNCTLSLSLECIFEPLFLTNEKKVLTKESDETRNEGNVNGGHASNIIDEEKINVSQDGTCNEKQDIERKEDTSDESEEIKETKNEILGNNQKEQNVVKPRARYDTVNVHVSNLMFWSNPSKNLNYSFDIFVLKLLYCPFHFNCFCFLHFDFRTVSFSYEDL